MIMSGGFVMNDNTNQLIASKKNQLIDPFITVSMAKSLEKIFRESLVVELAWEEKDRIQKLIIL